MSRTKNGAIRCDWCGKLSMSKDGALTRSDGTTTYIIQPEWERFADMPGNDAGKDICKDCELIELAKKGGE